MLPLIIMAIEDESDRDYMTSLYFQYNRLIYSELRKIINQSHDVEDLFQTVLEKLIDKVALLRTLERNALASYITSAARNTAFNFIRDKKVENGLWEEEQLVDSAPTPEEYIISKETLFRLAQVWEDLDEKTQYLLSAKYVLRKSGKEIAEDLNMTPDNVRMALVRARRKARQAMEKDNATDK